jgi:hypothetical protein
VAISKIKVERIKVGDTIGTPGDRKVRTLWGRVDKIEKTDGLVILCSREWATESNRKYGDGFGCYTARNGESLKVKK